MVDRAVKELSGQTDLGQAWQRFVHANDRVGIKVNGLGLRNMASNKETVIAIINGVMAAGVPAANIVVYDQWQGFLGATRLGRRDVPAGVRLLTHNNAILGRETRTPSGRTQYAQALLDCTAVIGVPLVKDHSLCGFTGAMKNMTHGSIKNPEDFHRHQCSPQIADLYNHEAIRSRVRLHVMDAFKVLYDRGPQDNPAARVPYEAIFVSTDPVALDRLGAEIVDDFRTRNRMTTLAARGPPVRYLESAESLGLERGRTATASRFAPSTSPDSPAIRRPCPPTASRPLTRDAARPWCSSTAAGCRRANGASWWNTSRRRTGWWRRTSWARATTRRGPMTPRFRSTTTSTRSTRG